jgi:iron complex transport system substrate-binding protein
MSEISSPNSAPPGHPREASSSIPSAPPRDSLFIETEEILFGATKIAEVEKTTKELDDITGAIVDSALKIHKDLGPGLLESVYEAVLAKLLGMQGYRVERKKAVPLEYEGMFFEEGYRLDLLVEGRVIVELRSVEKLAPVHGKQLLSYLRLMNQPVGLLINFGEATLKNGLHRIVNHLQPSASPRLRVNQMAPSAPSAPPHEPSTPILFASPRGVYIELS